MTELKLTRTQILMIVAVGVVLLWQGGGYVLSAAFGPFREKRDQLEKLAKAVEQKRMQAEAIDFARNRLRDWKSRSLPPDEVGAATSKKADALKAHLRYQQWITDLALLSGFDNPSIRPSAGRGMTRQGTTNVYFTMTVTVEADVTYGQLCTFLDHFYRTNLLHRITRLQVDSRESSGDPLMKVLIDAEAMAIADVAPRRTLFTETTLARPLSAGDAQLQVASPADFPKKPPFRIRIGGEYLTVTAMNGHDWTVARAAERTHAREHRAGERVEFAPINPAFPSLDAEQFREVLKANPFIKPPPPRKYEVKVGPLAEQVFERGRSLEFTIPVSDYDPTLGTPEFAITSGAPPGMQLDRNTGKVSWKPADDQSTGRFPMKVEVRHPSAPNGLREASVTVVFRDPNTRPKLSAPAAPVAFIGRTWKLKLDVQDAETPREKLSLRLGDGAPEGLEVDAAAGELRWTPPDTLSPGEFNVQVTVSDDGTPTQSSSVSLTLKLEDDAALFTRLVGIVNVNDDPIAVFYNQLSNRSLRVRVGDELNVSDIAGTVAEIHPKSVVIRQNDQLARLELSQHLRELTPLPSAEAKPREDAGTPAPEAAN